jgi:hypothetical protein
MSFSPAQDSMQYWQDIGGNGNDGSNAAAIDMATSQGTMNPGGVPGGPPTISPGTISAINGVGQTIGNLVTGNGVSKGYQTTATGYQNAGNTIGQYNTNSQKMLDPVTGLITQNAGNIENTAGTISGGAGTGVNTLQNVAGGNNLDISKYYNPSMAFTEQQGQQAIQRAASARGGLMSGGELKDISDYITGLATQNYNNAAQIALQQQGQQTGSASALVGNANNANNTLAGLVGTGATGAGTAATLNNQAGANIGQTQIGSAGSQGSATAAQSTGSGNALGSLGNVIGDVASIAALF